MHDDDEIAFLKTKLFYNPEDSYLYFYPRRDHEPHAKLFNARYVGLPAGTLSKTNGYWHVGVDYKVYRSHRIIWAFQYGRWPTAIDHIDGDRSNNFLYNLRECTHAENMRNRKGWGSSGLKGAFETPSGKWQSIVRIDGKAKSLGTFLDAQAAHNAYVAAMKEYHGSFFEGGHINDD